jgi:hypothetical protein
MMGQSEIRETLEKADELVTELKAFRNLSPESGNATSVTISAGGVGVWIATTACLVMLAVLLVGGLWMSRELNRIDVTMSERKEEADRMQTYLSAIYAQAPHLKPKDEEKKDQDRKNSP